MLNYLAAFFVLFLYKYPLDKVDHGTGTFGKEAVPDRDPVGGVGGSRGTTRLPSIIPLQLTGQCKHGYGAVICLALPHAALCCTALLLKCLTITQTIKNKLVNLIILQKREKTSHKNWTHQSMQTLQQILNRQQLVFLHTKYHTVPMLLIQ